MSWIALWDGAEGHFAPRAPGAPGADAPPDTALLPRGTLMLEARLAPEGRPQTLLDYARSHPWPMRLTINAVPGGGAVLALDQRGSVVHATLPLGAASAATCLRLGFAWDAPRRWARFSLEHLEEGAFHLGYIRNAPPLLLEDARALVRAPWARRLDPEVRVLAVSTRVEPVGPMPSLHGDTPVATPEGYRRIRKLRRGDLVLTPQGEAVPVLARLECTLPARGSFRPLRLRAPYFGLRRDVVAAPGQRLVLEGSQVEYLFGCESVLVPARHLVNGTAALWEPGPPPLITWHQLLLPRHEPMLAAGAALDSLPIGRLRRDPTRLDATLLAGLGRAHLPEHAGARHPVLRPAEAIALALQRAA